MIRKITEAQKALCELCKKSESSHLYGIYLCNYWSGQKKLPQHVYVKGKDSCPFFDLDKELI